MLSATATGPPASEKAGVPCSQLVKWEVEIQEAG